MSSRPSKEVRIAIIGGGLSGITLAINLRAQLGLESFTIYERASDIGGTWRDNSYPNCASDVPSHWYSLSTELNPDWTSKYSGQPEIQRYWQNVHAKHNLSLKTSLDSNFDSAIWNSATQSYICQFSRSSGEKFQIEADVVISCIGGFSTPQDKPAGMRGLEEFEGEVFHSARWDHTVDLSGKRVGVIGNGCSAAQFIPHISSDKSTEVINFVRTPNWFMPRDQKDYSSFTKSIFKHIPGVMRTYRNFIAATSDARYIVWILKMSGLRHYVEEVSTKYITDSAPKRYHDFLIPKYPFGCKRVIMDPGYLRSLHRSNVDLVTDPIAQITPRGIRGKSGIEHKLDVIILATGFDLSDSGLAINITGRGGKTLHEQWTEQGGPQAYLGTTVSGFPNFYQILGPNVASGSASVVYSTEAQVNLIVQLLEPMVKYGVESFECKVDAEMTYNREIQSKLNQTVWKGGCTSYYKLGDKVIATYPGPTTEFWYRTLSPVWENYIQTGGTRRMGVRHRSRQLFKILLLAGLVMGLRRLGMKKIKKELLVFGLMRYQDIMGLFDSLMGRA